MKVLRFALLAFVVLALVPTAAEASSAGRLFVVDADRGTLTPKGGDRFVLTLRGVDPRTTWFSDRPERLAGTRPTAGLVEDWQGLGFTADPPNAALVLGGGRRSADTMIVELGRPRYDGQARTLTMAVRRLKTATPALAGHARRADERVPRRFGRVSLFIDDATTRQMEIFLYNMLSTDVPRTRPTMSLLPATSVTGGAWDPSPLTVASRPDGDQWVAAFAGAGQGDGPFSGTISAAIAGDVSGTVSITWSWPAGATAPQWTATVSGADADQGRLKVRSVALPQGTGIMQLRVILTRT